MGCGKVVSQQEAGFIIHIVCNYAVVADLKDRKALIYKVGEACSECPADSCDDGLCSKGRQIRDCQNFQGQIVKGNNIREDIVDPNDACSALCSLDPNCQGWARNKKYGVCYLKSQIEEVEDNPDWDSGTKCQQPYSILF